LHFQRGLSLQTQRVLDRIDRLLQMAGTDKSKLLTAQVWLSDMSLFAARNAVWNAWVDPQNPPVRVCVRAELWQPKMLVEIMVTAAKWFEPDQDPRITRMAAQSSYHDWQSFVCIRGSLPGHTFRVLSSPKTTTATVYFHEHQATRVVKISSPWRSTSFLRVLSCHRILET
jgi:hypothetical protein